jgi:hypothetical protein
MNLQEFLEKTKEIKKLSDGYSFQTIRPRIVCKDGVSLSVQGSETHYCQPRYNDTTYYEVEIGYPSIRPPKDWEQYFDGTWQQIGVVGTLGRILSNWNMIWYNIKNKTWHFLFDHYLNFKDNATDSVYGYVPIKLVEDFINNHGGIDEEKTFTTK